MPSRDNEVMTITASELLAFLESGMQMSANYQPLILRQLLEGGGMASRRDLAATLLANDPWLQERADRTLMRWPKRTLTARGIVDYDGQTQVFRLRSPKLSEAERELALALCEERLASFSRPANRKVLSRRFAAIRRAQGRCQACGVPGSALPATDSLDVDHIVPRSRCIAGTRSVKLPWNNEVVDVDSPRNLQVLCPACNRGKRDSDDYRFVPDLSSLAEAIRAIRRKAIELGHSLNDLSAEVDRLDP